MMNSLNPDLYENFSVFKFMRNFSVHRIWGFGFPSAPSTTLKISFHCALTFFNENTTHSYFFLCYCFSGNKFLFSSFSLYLHFSSLTLMCLRYNVALFVFINLVCLRFTQLLEFVIYAFHQF